MPKALISVLLVEDHLLVGQAIAERLRQFDDFAVVGIATTASEGVRLAAELHPDVVLMDYGLPDFPGAEATRRIIENRPETKVVMLTGEVRSSAVLEAIEAGCVGYIAKGGTVRELDASIRPAAAGESLITPAVLADVLRGMQPSETSAPKLTERELEILRAMTAGRSNEQIASDLILSVFTVRKHVQNLMQKLNAHTRLEAVATAVRLGIVRMD